MSSRRAGEAWGAAAADWATLIEPWSLPYWAAAFESVEVGPDDHVLDIACGSGLALVVAQCRGARVAGIDAAEGLVHIARRRLPDGDVQVGDMNALPWPDDTFDVVASFNGIWAGCEPAMREASRVLASGGRFVIGFWGNPRQMDLVRSWGAALAELLPPDDFQSEARLLEIGRPGVAEAMLEEVGMGITERATVPVLIEFPDLDVAVRAYSSPGPSRLAIAHSGQGRWQERLRQAFEPFVSPDDGVVRLRNEAVFVTAGLQRGAAAV